MSAEAFQIGTVALLALVAICGAFLAIHRGRL